MHRSLFGDKRAWPEHRDRELIGATFMQTFGGKGANQAVAAARAGGSVCFVNCVGAGPPDGGYGDMIVENLRRDGIDVDYVFREDGVASGTALVMIGAGGENYLSVAPGANYCLSRQHVGRARGVIEQAAVVVLQCEIPADTLKYTVSGHGSWTAVGQNTWTSG